MKVANTLRFLGIATAVVFLAAQSPVQAQSPSEPEAKNEVQQTSPALLGTENSPVIVRVLPVERSKEEIAHEQEKERDAFNNERRLADLTGDLANYTLALAFGTIILAALTGGLLILGSKQLRDTRKSIAAAEIAALAARDQVLLGREEFSATFRPHLIVRNVRARDADPGNDVEITFDVINNGASEATIVASKFQTRFVNENGMFQTLSLPAVGEPPENHIGELILKPSAVYRGIFQAGKKWDVDHFHDHGKLEAGYFFGGKILYQDSTGKQRRLGIYRRMDVSSRRFRSVADSEFEYDD